jgi:putative DNA primase/helicase
MSEISRQERLKKAAVWYAGKDWKILPCHGLTEQGRCTCGGRHTEPKDIGKHPALMDWNDKASCDPNTVDQWWKNEPDNNIGVVCHKSGIFVVDIDPRSGGSKSYEKFLELLDYDLPETIEQYTGTYAGDSGPERGKHIFYKYDGNEKLVGNLKSANLPGIDIKHNGYVLLSPSRHASGVDYEWVKGKAPWEIPIAEAPENLLKVLRRGGARKSSGSSLDGSDWGWIGGLDYGSESERVEIDKILEEGIEEGERAVKLYSLACAISNKYGVENDMKRQMIENTMLRFNYEKVKPPLHVEGANGLLMHVRRAMDWVAENPVGYKLIPGLKEWAEGTKSKAKAKVKKAEPANIIRYESEERPSTSDPDDLIDAYQYLDGSIGGDVLGASRNGMSIFEALRGGNIDIPKDVDSLSEEEGGHAGIRSLSDLGNGRRLIDAFGSSVRYTPGMGWFIWNGQYWRPDQESLGMKELSKKLPPLIAAEVVNYDDADKKSEVVKWAGTSKSNGKLAACVEQANSDLRVVTDVDRWDSDPYLIGVNNGVVDLKTGELLKGRPDLYITKRTLVGYTPGLKNARWEDFIDFATGGDKELQDWLQLAAGYTLTGLNVHDALFLVYGPPGSGKNTFVEAMVKALDTKQYSFPLDSSILGSNNEGNSNTDLYHWAQLRGRRMVWTDELPDNERIKENSVKKLTGSSEISARSPGEQPFTFQSQGKLWITTNHRPQINDDAMWRRLRPVPWLHVPETSDPDLKAYLFDPDGGLPGVLAWMVEGAIKYLGSTSRDALGTCKAVEEASDMYRKNEDRLGMFLEEETREVEGSTLSVKILYTQYKYWAEDRGERPMAQISFHKKLSDRGLKFEGQGTHAELLNMTLMPRAMASPSSEMNWEDMTRFGRF